MSTSITYISFFLIFLTKQKAIGNYSEIFSPSSSGYFSHIKVIIRFVAQLRAPKIFFFSTVMTTPAHNCNTSPFIFYLYPQIKLIHL